MYEGIMVIMWYRNSTTTHPLIPERDRKGSKRSCTHKYKTQVTAGSVVVSNHNRSDLWFSGIVGSVEAYCWVCISLALKEILLLRGISCKLMDVFMMVSFVINKSQSIVWFVT